MNLQSTSAVLSAVTFESPSKGAKNDKSSFLGQRETLNRSSSASRSGPISGGASTLLQKIAESPYAESLTSRKTLVVADRTNLIHTDFFNGVQRRKALLVRLRDTALEPSNSQSILKRFLLEIRQLTLRLIEDSLEMEYRAQVVDSNNISSSNKSAKSSKQAQQKDITTFMDIEIKSQIYALKEMVTDVDHLFKIDNIRSMLSKDFPHYRNPFMLGKSVDQLADILPPHAEPGDREVELKILELLRFKRASKVLLRAETEVLNRLPVVLSGIDVLVARMADDHNIERLLRCICTFVDNIESSKNRDAPPNFGSLTTTPFRVEAHILLRNVNKYRGEQPMRMDIQAAVRLMMNKVNLDAFEGDSTVTFFVEWINSVLRHSLSNSLKPSVEPISMPNSSEPAKFQEYGTKIKPLSVRNVTDHKYGDLNSEVVTPRKMDTHESFYVESSPKRKVIDRTASPTNIINASTADKGKSISFAADKASYSRKQMSRGGSSSANAAQQQLLEQQQFQMEQLQQQLQQQQMQMQQFMMSGPPTVDPNSAPGVAAIAPVAAVAAFDLVELKQQISKVISEMGLLSKNKNSNQKPQKTALMAQVENEEKGNKEDEDAIRPPGPHEVASSLSTLRYQLFKMQQELLRRQVLDGRHYKASGFDAIQQSKNGLTVIDTDPTNGNFYSPMSNLPKSSDNISSPTDKSDVVAPYSIDEIHLLDSEIPPLNGTTRSIECNYDTAAEKLICRVKKMVAEPVAPKSGDDDDDDEGAYRVAKKKKVKYVAVCTAFMIVSKLVFNLLTEHTITKLLENTSDGQKVMLRSILEQVQKRASETPEPKGQIVLQIERLLHQCNHIDGGVEVEIVITRNKECDGIEVQCTPIAGVSIENISAGPVTIVVSDRELQVLLINQYGMLSQSRSKWRAMVMVAQWITARVRVQRVLTTQPSMTTFDGMNTFSDLFAQTAPATATTTADIPQLMDAGEMDMSKTLPSETNMRNSVNQNPLTTILPKTASQAKRNLVLFDVQLDRKIELSTDIRARWKSRSVPNIVGIVVGLKAWQDLDMLLLSVDIRLPTQNQYLVLKDKLEKSKKKEAPRKTAGVANARRQKRLAALAGNNEDEGDEEDESDSEDEESLEKLKGTTEMNFEYTLTYAELSVFGTSELIMQKKVGLQSTKGEQEHPEAFIWNILSRYQISFSGSLKNPFAEDCSIVDPTNWQSNFDRRVLREVKTISSCVLVVSVSVVGPELLFESETVDKSAKKRIIAKTMTENELRDVVHSEGLSPLLLEYPRRKELAQAMLSKLKLVEDNGSRDETGMLSDVATFRLELLSFYETKMLKIAVQKKPNQPIVDIGVVEINYQLTLSDLRILIRFEIDAEEIPNQFRFVYKGSPCSIKQEQFRRAWDCIPRCIIAPKMVEKIESGIETEDIEEKRNKIALNKMAGKHARLVRGQRRVSGKFVAMPILTLCQVTENAEEIYLLHDSRDLLAAGDIIRIGNVLSRDYIVAAMSKIETNAYPKTIKIEPSYDLLEEPDFNVPTTGNFIYPKGVAGIITVNFKKINVLPPPSSFGFHYEIPKPEDPSSSSSSALGNQGSATMSDNLKSLLNKSKKTMPANQTYMNCWIWKCIPAAEDTRPKWRQLYDDGLVPYDYEFKASSEYFKYFRVKALYSYLEILCTDARCAAMSPYKQRVDEMESFTIEYYLKLIFDKVTGWSPEYKRGMEKLKYMKLLKDVNALTDLKRPSRVTQLENLFAKEVKENGISNKFVTYDGFVRLLQDIAMIRFPPPKKPGEEDQDDQSISSLPESVASTNISNSVAAATSSNHAKLGRIGRKDSSLADAQSVASENKSIVDLQYAASVLEKFVLDIVMMYPDWYSIPWREAKLTVMQKEARPYCAVTRIAATFRGWIQWRRYHFCIRNIIVFQASVRRLFSRRWTQAYLKILTDDWIFRQRYHAAARAQSVVRLFLKRCWFWRIMEKIRAQEVIVQKARRFRIKKIRQAQKKFILYKEAVRVNGVLCYIKMLKLDTRNYSRDNGVMLEVYTPYDQRKYQFPIEEIDLRKYMQMALEVEVVSVGDLIDVRNLKKVVAQRIIAYKATSRFASQNVVFSKHALGQRGEQKIKRGKIINGELFVCKIFETGDDFSIQCYHNHTCKVFVATVTKMDLRAWIADEFLTGSSRIDQQSPDQLQLSMQKVPIILLPENIRFLQQWLLDNLAVDTRQGKFRVLFRRQLQKSRKLEKIIKIQSHFRRVLTRKVIIEKLDALMLKVRVSPTDSTIYYLNKKTGASSWHKPKVLGPHDITTEPMRKWIEVTYLHDGMRYRHYVNPHTGKYTNFTPDQAAKKIQSLSRNFLLRPIKMPFDQFVKAGSIYKTAQQIYDKEKGKRKLAAVINYAITSHVVDLDEPLGKRLYGEAVDLSEANPLVTRAFAFYMLGTCEAPLALNRDRANTLFEDAKRKDETHAKFQIAYYIYRFACLRNPYDHRTLLNLALVQCLLYNQNYNAEKLLRRALAMSPFDERVMEIWKFLQDRFPDRQLLYNPASRVNLVKMDKSGKKRIIHGRPASQHNSWAGWVFIDDDEFGVSKKYRRHASYWYNPADGTEQQDLPDFKKQWAIRKQRSHYQEQEDGILQYFDPLTSEYFQYHELTDSYA